MNGNLTADLIAKPWVGQVAPLVELKDGRVELLECLPDLAA
jgi:hypothetical protein